MNIPNIIPEYISVGQAEQDIVIDYNVDLPPSVLMTLTIFFEGSDEAHGWKIPTISMGTRAAKARIPSFEQYGYYTVIPKFQNIENPKFPPFQLRVLSPVETLINVLAPEENPYNATASKATSAVVAALFAYVIQNEQQGLTEDHDMVDQVLSEILMNMEKPIVSLAEFLCGQYLQGDTLLHFCIRHNYIGTCNLIYQSSDETSLQQSLLTKGFDGKTPIELTEMFRMNGLSALFKNSLIYGRAAQEQRDNFEHKEHKPRKTKFSRIKKVIKTKIIAKLEEINSDDQSATSEGRQPDISQSLLQHLRVTALYSATVVKAYDTIDQYFGTISLKVGDIAFVTREEDKQWCTGIVNDKYCRFPMDILQHEYHQHKLVNQSKSVQIRDLEDFQQLEDERKKYAQYINEKQSHHAAKRLPYPSAVTRSCSVETGLDEMSNCSPVMKRKPLPAFPMNRREQITHRDVPLPERPLEDPDSSGDEYEKVEFNNTLQIPSKKIQPLQAKPSWPAYPHQQQSPVQLRKPISQQSPVQLKKPISQQSPVQLRKPILQQSPVPVEKPQESSRPTHNLQHQSSVPSQKKNAQPSQAPITRPQQSPVPRQKTTLPTTLSNSSTSSSPGRKNVDKGSDEEEDGDAPTMYGVKVLPSTGNSRSKNGAIGTNPLTQKRPSSFAASTRSSLISNVSTASSTGGKEMEESFDEDAYDDVSVTYGSRVEVLPVTGSQNHGVVLNPPTGKINDSFTSKGSSLSSSTVDSTTQGGKQTSSDEDEYDDVSLIYRAANEGTNHSAMQEKSEPIKGGRHSYENASTPKEVKKKPPTPLVKPSKSVNSSLPKPNNMSDGFKRTANEGTVMADDITVRKKPDPPPRNITRPEMSEEPVPGNNSFSHQNTTSTSSESTKAALKLPPLPPKKTTATNSPKLSMKYANQKADQESLPVKMMNKNTESSPETKPTKFRDLQNVFEGK